MSNLGKIKFLADDKMIQLFVLIMCEMILIREFWLT